MRISYRTGKSMEDNLYTLFLQSEDIELVCLENQNPDRWGERTEEGIPWLSPDEAARLFNEGKIDAFIINPEFRWQNLCRIFLEKQNVCRYREDVGYLPKDWTEGHHAVTAHDLKAFGLHYDDLLFDIKSLRYLEYHLVDHCNLNCAGCCHFSPLVSGPSFVSLDQMEQDFTLLQKFVNHIWRIRILGGEPLLHPQWKEHLALARRFWPLAEINLVTNGILIPSLKNSDFDFFRENNIRVNFSVYPPMQPKMNEFAKLFEKQNVFCIMSKVDAFSPLLNPNSTDDYREKSDRCTMWCINLRDGAMTRCPILMYIPIYNSHYHTDYPEEEPIRLKDVKDYEDLVEKLAQPKKLCAQCIYFDSFGGDKGAEHWQQWRQFYASGDASENGWEEKIG